MTTLADLPLAAYDCETTGVDTATVRIVTAAFVVAGQPDNDHSWMLDPGIDIPEGAAKVHGITTDKARAEGMDYAIAYAEIRDAVETHWARGGIIAIYNAPFDLSILDNEGRRLGYPPLAVGAVLDPFVVDRALDPYRRGSRKLVDTLNIYFPDSDTEDAHAADWDARAAGRLAWKLLQHNNLADYDVDALMAAQAAWHRDRQDSYRQWLLGRGETERAETVSSEWPLQHKAA